MKMAMMHNVICGVAAVVAAFALVACQASSPYSKVRHAPPGPDEAGLPAPTADHPEARVYLGAVLSTNTSEAEYPLFDALHRQPLEKTRPLLQALGMIQDYHLTTLPTTPPGGKGVPWEEGWEKAVNNRHRLLYRHRFETSTEGRIGWVFQGDFPHGGNNAKTAMCELLAVLTMDDYQVLRFEKSRMLLMSTPVQVSTLTPGTSAVDFLMNDGTLANRLIFSERGITFVQGR